MKRFINLIFITSLLLVSFSSYLINTVEASEPSYGIVNFNTKSCGTNTYYTSTSNLKSGYLNGCYTGTAAFLGYNADRSKVKFMVSGVEGWVNTSDVEIIDYEAKFNTTYTTSYRVRNGEIAHNIYLNPHSPSGYTLITLGPAPTYLSDGNYYSYDGIYFYDDTIAGYKAMINDYKAGHNNSAINKNSPYYNYYLYLTHRTISNYTSTDITEYLNTINVPSYSLLYGEEKSFIQYQNEFGANAGMTLGVAQNESANGTSNIALTKNNLFGHAAFDATPGDSASNYTDPTQSIYGHAKIYVSEGYMDSKDYAGRYNGGHVGNKNSGFNIKYASDPYWGEKMATNFYKFDKYNGLQDFNKYTIGIKQGNENVNIYKEATQTSNVLYSTGTIPDYPVIILEEVVGTSINGNNVWYKIQSDVTLNSSRTGIIQDTGYYNPNHNYGYVHSSNFIKSNAGTALKPIYEITFNPNGGTFPDTVTANKKLYVEQYSVPEINEPTKSGDVFLGWDSELLGATGNMTYTAVWKSSQFTITFNADGGVFNNGAGTKSSTYKHGVIPTIDEPTKSGFTFVGWDSEIVSVTGNKTYTAIWKKDATYYDITFNADGGLFSNNKETIIVNTAEGDKPVVENPTKAGYVFDSWDKEIIAVTGVTTYTAVWREGTVEDLLINKSGTFYLEYLKIVDGNLEIKGYNTINDIHNDLNTNITYELVLVNQNTGEEEVVVLNRLIDTSQMTMPPYSPNGYNYTYSWFKDTIEVETIKEGNYTLYLRSYNDKYFSKNIVNNKLLNTQATNYESGFNSVTIVNNYRDSNLPIEFYVRENAIGTKETTAYSNQYSIINEIKFENSKLVLNAATYSVGLDMRTSTNLTRNIVFENIDTFETFTYSLTTTDPLYPIRLISADAFGLGKDQAWFNNKLDISELSKGNYAVYVTSESNVKDYGELYDVLFADLSSAKTIIDGKEYIFSINRDLRDRLELEIK